MRLHALVALAVLAIAATGCAPDSFVCERSEQCVRGADQGVCQPAGVCSFADPLCASGQRYGDYAGDRSNTCVGGDEPDTGAPPDGASDPDAPPADAAPADGPDHGPPDGRGPDETLRFGEGNGADVTGVSRDTWIDSESQTRNHGGQNELRADGDPQRHALMRIDVSALPAGAVVVSAQLRLSTTGNGHLASGRIAIYPLLEDWDEGAADDGVGVASWALRSGVTPWATIGAGAPGSRGTTPLATFTPSADDTSYDIALPPAIIEAWRDPGANHGFILVAESAGSESGFFVSRGGARAKRPLLTVTFHR